MSRCVVCGNSLPEASRSDRRTCSSKCRMALSRRLTARRPDHIPEPSREWLEAGAVNICACAVRVLPNADGTWRHDPRDI